ncbi:hypothetical protein [Streptomyces xinghaiensis]|uniref:hypothetical protein n=1 Tax=Streptomyces xinghaiensis TaxID=1038928 RepID=UPI0034316D6F
MTDTVRVGKVLTDLMQAGHTTALEQLPGVVAAHAETVGLHDVALFAVDLQQKVLRQLTGRGPDAGEGGTEVAVDGTLPGRAYQNVTIVSEPAPETAGGRCRWWVPVTDGVERLGIMRTDTAGRTDRAGKRSAIWPRWWRCCCSASGPSATRTPVSCAAGR